MSIIRKVEARSRGPGRHPSRAALRRVDAELRAFHEALVSLPIPDRLRAAVIAPAAGPTTSGMPAATPLGREDR